ncbi:MAG: thymidine phosphorylase, partial [Ignavibacteria bacterium]
MNFVEIIKKKRDGLPLNTDEINYLITQYTRGIIPDYQFSALLMAILLKGMNPTETAALTNSMLNSGKVINLNFIKEYKVDKHSTGG